VATTSVIATDQLHVDPKRTTLATAGKRATLPLPLLLVDCGFQVAEDSFIAEGSFIMDQSGVAGQKDLSKTELNHHKV
jgi:hypothetical protein